MFLFFTLIIIISTGVGYLLNVGKKSIPQVSGETDLPGLTKPIEISRDNYSIAHIQGTDIKDLSRAMGYTHAQDRYFQMELMRRLGSGQLAEIFGAEAIPHDRLARSLQLAGAAEAEFQRASSIAQEILNSYAEGVNAYREQNVKQLPPEFKILNFVPKQWQATDSLTIGKWFAYILSSNGSTELLRGQLIDIVGLESAYLLTGLAPPGNEIKSQSTTLYPLETTSNAIFRSNIHRGASNAWVIGSTRSTSGKPLLASDPHLSLTMPSIFYEIILSGDEINVAGASIPGIPLILIGQNQRIAWGVTALFADVQDIYVETINPIDSNQYLWNKKWNNIKSFTEQINVKNSSPVIETVSTTRNGLVIGKTSSGQLLTQKWDSIWHGDHTTALLSMNQAQSWVQFIEALRGWSSPALSFVYADVEGNIGFFPAGMIPTRAHHYGAVPVDAASGENEWSGFIQHELKPRIFNPPADLLISANHSMLSKEKQHLFGGDTLADFRSKRIKSLLDRKTTLSLKDLGHIQNDRYDPSSKAILKVALTLKPRNKTESTALRILQNWDGHMNEGPAPLIYYALYIETLKSTFLDELGSEVFDDYLNFVELGYNNGLHAIINNNKSPFWDNISTDEIESRNKIFQQSFSKALGNLAILGDDIETLDWVSIHTVEFQHPLGQFQPLHWLFSRGPIGFGGSTATIANSRVSLKTPFKTISGTSFRFLADLSDLNKSRSSIPTGISGHPLSPHYFDQNDLWLKGTTHLLLGQQVGRKLILQP